jgi:hypothetical protein
MRPMIWHPEEKDTEVNHYLDQMNHAPYATIFALILGLICLFTGVVLIGIF